MADKALIIKETQKYLAKGQIDKAITEWENFLQSSPDANSFNTLGDLYLKKKNGQQSAIEKFHRAAEIFRKEGFSLKALALYKKILNIIPSDAKSLYVLGELSEEKNIVADAIKYYLSAGDLFMKQGLKTEAVRTYSKMIRLSPDNLALRKQIAEVYSKEGFVEEVSYEYVEIARLLENRGETETAIKYLDHAVEIKPTNRAALSAMASLYEKTGEKEKAVESLKTAVTRTGKSDELLLRLAKLCLNTGKLDEARQYTEELLQKDPDNLEAKRASADFYFRQGDMKNAWAQYVPIIEELVFKNQFDEAESILALFMEAEPAHARKVLIALCKQKNDNVRALGELKKLGELLSASGDVNGAAACFREALSMSPGDEQLARMLHEFTNEPGAAEEEKAEAEIPKAEMPEYEKIKKSQEIFQDEMSRDTVAEEAGKYESDSLQDLMSQADGMLAYGKLEEAREILESLKLKAPGDIALHLKLKSVYLSANDRQQAVTECIILAELYRRAGDEAKKNEVINEAFEIDPSDERLPERFGRREAPAATEAEKETGPVKLDSIAQPADSTSRLDDSTSRSADSTSRPDKAEYAEKLSEAAFYLDQGLYEEAEKIYNELKTHFPLDESIKAKLEEIEALKNQPDIRESATDTWEGGLSGLGQTPVSGDVPEGELEGDVVRIFDEFKKGVEKQIEPGDAETRYNLGIAYIEMGLLDDAIREFQSVLSEPEYGIKAASFLAKCYIDKGSYLLAVEALTSVLKDMDPAHEAYWGLKYDLAQAREKNAEPKEALQLYSEISGWNSGFREVAARIKALGGTAPGGNGKKPASRKDRISYI